MLDGQELLDYIGKNLGVGFEVISNVTSNGICESKIKLTNDGDQTIPKGNWAIYTYHMRQIDSETVEMETEHIVGGLFKLYPTDNFKKIKPGDKLIIPLSSDDATASRFYNFPNWYVTEDGLKPRIIESTVGESLAFVKDFDTPLKWKKSKLDKFNPLTPEQRYKKYNIKDLGKAGNLILPTPKLYNADETKHVDLETGKWVVYNSVAEFKSEAELLAKELGLEISNEAPPNGSRSAFNFKLEKLEDASNEAYELDINAEEASVTLRANSSAGAFYAVHSVLSLMIDQSEAGKFLPCVQIKDSPRFMYRGLHIDVARNFVSADEIKKLIQVISMYKMNKLHLHLTDDEGWRIEIKGLPELTEIGSIRDHVLAGEGLAVEPTLGSGPYHTASTCGFYTCAEYQDILLYAKEHHVEVIPEIDMPGHSYAAVVAMTARYHKYKEEGKMDAAKEYMLVEFGENASYTSDQKYTNNTMNPCLDGTKNFVSKVIKELKALHEPIQPLRVFHVGGDEVPIGAWDASKICEQFYKDNNLDGTDPLFDPLDFDNDDEIESRKMTSAIQEYFIKYVEDVCKKENLQLGVWNDGIYDLMEKQTSDPPKLVHAWRISRKNERYNPNILANSGYQVVISSATHTYFDHPYEPDPEENGLYWCVRMMDTRTVFGMKPLDMYSCQDERFNKTSHKKLDDKSKVIGIQAQIWGELIRCEERLEYMLFPRILAIAERAWHETKWENEESNEEQENDWIKFANTVRYKELRRLENIGVHYRIPPPGVLVRDDKVTVGSVYPGMSYKYRKSGDEVWLEWPISTPKKVFEEGQKYEFVTTSLNGERFSRIITWDF